MQMRKTMPDFSMRPSAADLPPAARSAIVMPAFTLIELLVVISIIAILIGILLPALSKYRMQGYVTSTTEELSSVKTACLMYYTNYNAYPGPFSETDVASGAVGVTGTQNMLIGLMGTMYNAAPTSLPAGTTTVSISGSTSGGGTAYVTNPLGSGPIDYSNGNVQQKSYLSPDPTLLLTISANGGNTSLPTLYDTFTEGLPIMYYRKIPGVLRSGSVPVGTNSGGAFYLNSNYAYFHNSVLKASSGTVYNETQQSTLNGSNATTALAYELVPTGSYTVSTATLPLGSSVTPSGAPNASGQSVIGGFALISAGPDRIYGPPLATDASQGSPGTLTWASAATSDDIIVGGGQ